MLTSLKKVFVSMLITSSTALTGCSDIWQVLGYSKKSPDEFLVTSRVVPILPPKNLDMLPDPKLVVNSSQKRSVFNKVYQVLTGHQSGKREDLGVEQSKVSLGVRIFLHKIGTNASDRNIRHLVDSEIKEVPLIK